MTREEELPKQESLDEIAQAIDKLPRMVVIVGVQSVVVPQVSHAAVQDILMRYRR